MIYCGITIDYLSQMERSGHKGASDLIQALRSEAASLGGSASQRDQPLVLSFPEQGPFGPLLAAEAIRRAKALVDAEAPRLHGASIGVHRADDQDDLPSVVNSLRFATAEAFSCRLSPEARAALKPHIRPASNADPAAWADPYHVQALADADLSALSRSAAVAAGIAKTLERGPGRLVSVPAPKSSRSAASIRASLETLSPPGRVIALTASPRPVRPFSPFVDAMDEGLMAEFLAASAPESRARLVSLMPAFRIASSSAFSAGLDPAAAKGCVDFLHLMLDYLGSLGTVLLCESPERFSPEATELVAARLEAGRGLERYVALVDADLPESWIPEAVGAQDGIAPPSGSEAAASALGNASGSVRELLGRRARAMLEEAGAADDDGLALLSALPREASLYLYGLLLAENVLTPGETADFFAGMGLSPEGAKVIQSLLVRAGLVDPAMGTKPLPPMDAGGVASSIGKQGTALMDGKFSSFLVGKYRAGGIKPSLGFLRRVGERDDDERLVFDCLFEEALGGGPGMHGEKSFLSPSSAGVLRFWRALHAKDRDASEAAAAQASDRVEGPRAAALKALMKAELAYANGDTERSGLGAREALLSLGRGAPPKLEARAHRMMGLSALAAERYIEASDYLANAQELSEACRDEYERMMAAYAKAIAEFMSGSLGRSLRDLDHAAESAARLFRMDAAAAVESLRGRIDMELGAYDDAARRYASIAGLADEYGLAEASRRALVWKGRSLSYASAYDEAAALLERMPDDPESRVFRGELEILRGRPRDARAWLDAPPEPAVRDFRPPDSFEWSSSFAEVEGRCLGFDAANAPLADMRLALSCFARGLDERDPGAAVDLYALTRGKRAGKPNPGMGTYCFFCYLLEERLPEPPVDKQTVLSRAFKALQQRAGKIEDRSQRALYMEKNAWNRRLIEAARTHKFI